MFDVYAISEFVNCKLECLIGNYLTAIPSDLMDELVRMLLLANKQPVFS